MTPFASATVRTQPQSRPCHESIPLRLNLTHPPLVPNGGYAASCMLAAAREHLLPRGQPDALTAHFEYPSRAGPGPAVVKVEDVKLRDGQLSTLHLALWQGGLLQQAPWTSASSRRIILAYTTHTNLRNFAGITLPTGFEGTAAAEGPPLPDFKALVGAGRDGKWEESRLPGPARAAARSLQRWNFYVPRGGPLAPGVLDMWTRLSSGERITQCALPYVVDSFPVSRPPSTDFIFLKACIYPLCPYHTMEPWCYIVACRTGCRQNILVPHCLTIIYLLV